MKVEEYMKGLKEPLRQVTLCLLIKGEDILLARKKRGFGEGRWNGIGGKVNQGEDVKEAAVRETFEEIKVKLKSLKRVGRVKFYVPSKPEWNQEMIVYTVTEWEGEPEETEEMAPKWFKTFEVPFDQMWKDDALWLPSVLDGKRVEADFLMTEKGDILDYTIEEID